MSLPLAVKSNESHARTCLSIVLNRETLDNFLSCALCVHVVSSAGLFFQNEQLCPLAPRDRSPQMCHSLLRPAWTPFLLRRVRSCVFMDSRSFLISPRDFLVFLSHLDRQCSHTEPLLGFRAPHMLYLSLVELFLLVPLSVWQVQTLLFFQSCCPRV